MGMVIGMKYFNRRDIHFSERGKRDTLRGKRLGVCLPLSPIRNQLDVMINARSKL